MVVVGDLQVLDSRRKEKQMSAAKVNRPRLAYFNIKGDNIHYPGLDVGRKRKGSACPFFDRLTGTMVAQYLSDKDRQVYFDEKVANTFLIVYPDKQEAYKIQPYQYGQNIFYDFSTLAEWEVVIVDEEDKV